MKQVIIAITLGGLVLGLGCKQKPASTAPAPKAQASKKTLLRYHFVGAGHFGDSPDGSQFKKIWGMPETPPFRDALLARLAEVWGRSATNRIPGLGTNAAALFRPLLDDLLQAESLAEVRETAQGVRELDLAIQLADERAQVWSTNLWQIASSWNIAAPTESSRDGAIGWESKNGNYSDSVRLFRTGQWLVVTVGHDQAPGNLLQRIAAQGRPIDVAKKYWLDADVDCAQLKRWFPGARFSALLADLQVKNFPKAHLTVSPSGENLISQARLSYAEPVSWKPEPWQLSTNLIQNPEDTLINFTAARGLSTLLRESKILEQFGFSTRPSQFYSWAYGLSPLHSYVAFPMPVATNLVAQVAPRLEAFVQTNVAASVMGNVTWNSDRTSLRWDRMPVVQPAFGAVKLTEGDFLFGELVSLPPLTNPPPPPELLANFTRTNLIYYDWEITQHRLVQWRAMTSLADLVRIERTILQNTPAQYWLNMAVTNVGNAVTELSLVSPKEVEFLRSSHLGLTGFELVFLSRWVDANNFAPPDPESPAVKGKAANNASNAP